MRLEVKNRPPNDETEAMSNLSDLLGGVYGDDGDDDTNDNANAGDDTPTTSTPPDAGDPEEAAVPPDAPEQPSSEASPSDPVPDPGDSGPGDSATSPASDGPAWASDDRLDAAFDEWAPGSLPGHTRDEREELTSDIEDEPRAVTGIEAASDAAAAAGSGVSGDPTTAPSPPAVEIGEALTIDRSAPDAGASPDDAVTVAGVGSLPYDEPSEPAASTAPEPTVPATKWQRSDDDIIPHGGVGGILARLLGR